MGRDSMWKMLRINFLLITLLLSLACSSTRATVSYDDKAFIINGKRRILISGSIHYPRSTPQVPIPMPMRFSFSFSLYIFFSFGNLYYFSKFLQIHFSPSHESTVVYLGWMQMWPDLIQKAKDGGLDVIQTYVFWNAHEPSPGKVFSPKLHSNFDLALQF